MSETNNETIIKYHLSVISFRILKEITLKLEIYPIRSRDNLKNVEFWKNRVFMSQTNDKTISDGHLSIMSFKI